MCIPGARRISCACLLLSIVDRVCCQTGWSAKGFCATLFCRTGQPGSNTKSNRLVSLRLTCEPCHAAGNSGENTGYGHHCTVVPVTSFLPKRSFAKPILKHPRLHSRLRRKLNFSGRGVQYNTLCMQRRRYRKGASERSRTQANRIECKEQ